MPDDKREEKRRAGQEAAAAERTIKSLMSTYEGRWWMAEMLSYCNMYSDAYRFDGDQLGMAWRDGRANVGRMLLGQIDSFASNDYQRLIREMNARNTREIEKTAKAAEDVRKEESGEIEFRSPMEELADKQMTEFEAKRRVEGEPKTE